MAQNTQQALHSHETTSQRIQGNNDFCGISNSVREHFRPRISIGLPVYNGENYVAEAIQSILNQSYDNFELIVSDNASTDRTAEICLAMAQQDSRISYYRQTENLGAIANYNFVFNQSRGEYFKWAAHDDLIAPAFLEKCIEALDRHPEVVMAFPGISFVNENGEPQRKSELMMSIRATSPVRRIRHFAALQKDSLDVFWSIFGLIRSEALRRTGLFGSFVACDQVLLMKLLLQGQFHQVPEHLYSRRVHAKASTVSLPKTTTYRERARWYDTRIQPRVVLPNWRLVLENLSAVKGSSASFGAKLSSYFAVTRMFGWRWRRMIRELTSVPAQILGWR